jgi:hypothetical protein
MSVTPATKRDTEGTKGRRDKKTTRQGKPICSILTAKVLSRLYNQNGKSLEDVARLFGCTRMYVMKLARKYNIPLRRKREARYLALKAGKLPHKYREVNHNFFSVWTSKMAYVFGYFCADGNLYRDKRTKGWYVRFSSNDRDHLETIRRVMKSTHGFVVNERQPKLATLTIVSEKLALDLLALGVTPRKSLTLTFPSVPQEYLNDFVRGYFDGDGSIYLEAQRRQSPRISFVSGSKNFLVTLRQHLETILPSMLGRLYKNKPGRSYLLRYSRQGDIVRMFEFLYPEGQEILCLRRKYQKFWEAVSYLVSNNPICDHPINTNVWRLAAATRKERIQQKMKELQKFADLRPEYRKWVEGRVKELEQMIKGKDLL